MPGALGAAAAARLGAITSAPCVDDIVADSTWQALVARWSEPQLLELLMLAGRYRLVSGVLTSTGVPLGPSTPGWPAGADPKSVRPAPRDGDAVLARDPEAPCGRYELTLVTVDAPVHHN